MDATTLAPVPGATVEIVGTNLGTLTNDDGRYLLRGVPIGSHTVRVGSIGYAAQEQAVEVTAGQTVTVDLALTTQAIELGGIVAVGYGTVRREDLTGSVSSIQS
ncbi:MAG: carboxypeptidase-like regulatory domain-containing protein, partial [Gemmatimonadota bacterium]